MMLRIHFLQLFYNLSDSAISRTRTTTLNFLHLLERHKLGEKLFSQTNKHLDREGVFLNSLFSHLLNAIENHSK